MAFSFSKTTAAAPTMGTNTLSFGAVPNQTAPQFGAPSQGGFQFNSPATANAAPSLFGTPPTGAAAPLNFKQTTTPGLSFNMPGSTPASGGLFGAPAAASTPGGFGGFGAPAAATGGFGAPAAATGGFGAPAAAATGGFGAAAATSTFGVASGGFGAPAAATGGFGAPAAATGGFGAPAAATGGFGAPAAAAPTLSGFGAPAVASVAPTLNFGAPTATSTAAGGLTFGAAAPAAGGLSFGAPATSTTPGLGFGTPASQAAPLSFGLAPAATSTGMFGAQPANSAAPTLSLNFGGATSAPTLNFSAAAPSTGLSFGLGGTTTTPSAGFGLGAATAATPKSTGLGGIASTQAKTGAAVTTLKEVPPKEQPLPNEILTLVTQFKEFVKQQKIYSSDIARCSVKEFRKVESEIDLLNGLITDVETQLQKHRHVAEKLKYDTAKCLRDVEMAQRTQDTPPGLQYENTAPFGYFMELVENFEKDMQLIKMQIDSADKYVKSHRDNDTLSSQDLAMGMRRLHDTFVALAGRLQSVHSQVESHKEMYINLRKHLYNDSSDPFENVDKKPDPLGSHLKKSVIYSPPKVSSGPTPFNNLAFANGSLGIQQSQGPPPAYPSTSYPATGFGANVSFGAPNQSMQTPRPSMFGQPQQTMFGQSFELQKPPAGNKRSNKSFLF